MLAGARHNHPHVSRAGVSVPCDDYLEPPTVLAWDGPLPNPAPTRRSWSSRAKTSRSCACSSATRAAAEGLGEDRLSDLVLAVNELATNSMRHGGGRGLLSVWRENGTLLCEVHDRGHIADPLAGRELPPDVRGGGRGLWLVNHLCDLVQVRSSKAGNVIRLHMSLGAAF